MRTKLLVIITMIVVVVLVALVLLNNASSIDEEIATEFDTIPSLEGQPYLGNQEAPVKIIEFGDYKCPSCKSWDETIFPQLKEEYIEEGIVQFIHINTPFHGEESLLAAQASESVWNQNKDAFWEYHKAIYQNQPAMQQHDNHWVTEETLVDIAESIDANLNLDKLEMDLQNNSFSEQMEIDINLVDQFEITQTPTIMVNKYQMNNPFDYDQLVELIEMETKK